MANRPKPEKTISTKTRVNSVYLWVKQKWAAAPNPTRELATTTHNNKLFMPAATYSPTPSRV
ncbi:hypothetical protein, partial [Corynebacterium amycolatum]|uniref:hypothetical protein n=1 Tax=Corynebacterium amycolatum TaxID=43765 RepID=UPI001CD64421